jgi:DNA-binding transcriptional MerR regulator
MGSGLLEIGAVARALGVAPSTLRTWERRYRLVEPHRGERGQRLYDSEQILVLRRVLAQLGRGSRARAAHELASRPRPTGASRDRFEPSPTAPADARRAIDALLSGHDDPHFAFQLRLIASELVKNAVLYGSARDPIRMEARLFPAYAELRVQNGGSRLSLKRLRGRAGTGSGRGLEIIDALAEAWTIDTGPRGTKITVRLPTIPRSTRARHAPRDADV